MKSDHPRTMHRKNYAPGHEITAYGIRKIIMQLVLVFIALGLAGLGACALNADDQTLTPTSIFKAKDFPDPEPGKPAWKGDGWSSGICVFDKWVYTVSSAGYVLQFKRDLNTAKMEYIGATAFGFTPDPTSGIMNAFTRKLANGNMLLYFVFGNHGPHELVWYTLDKQTGKPAFKGKQAPVASHTFWSYQYVSSVDRIYGAFTRAEKGPVAAWHFDEKGAVVQDGRIATNGLSLYGWMVASPDGRNFYHVNLKDKTVDAYTCDVKTGALAYLAPAGEAIGDDDLAPVTPDGRHVYAFGKKLTIFERDPENGKLKVVSGGNADPKFLGLRGCQYAISHFWFAFSADGKKGAFTAAKGLTGFFTRNPVTGMLTVGATAPASLLGAARLTMDPASGHLFTVGENIASFK